MITNEEIAMEIYNKKYKDCCWREKARIRGILFARQEEVRDTKGERK